MPIIGDYEPYCGRYSAVKGVLAEAFCEPHIMRMVRRHDYDSTGLQLSDGFMNRLQVLRAWASLPWHQRMAIELSIGPHHWDQKKIARRLGRTDRTVRNYIHDGMETIITRVFGGPTP